MIIKLNKKLSELKIGVMGTRKNLLSEVLDDKGIPYIEIEELQEIDSSFDIVFGSGIYKIVPSKYLNKPALGLIFFHETPLPEGKGNAPIQWTILNKKHNLTITAFKAVEAMDGGDYVYQYNISVSKTDTLETLNRKRATGIKRCLESIIEELEQGCLVSRKQSGESSVSPKRTPKDSGLDPNETLMNLWDNIRVCHNDDYPAFFIVDGKKVILRYEVVDQD